jgi:transcriptional regulator GlxA family with amidase domain
MSIFTAAPPPDHTVIRRTVDYVNRNLPADLTTGTLAKSAGVSERHLTRLFLTHVGQTPGRFVRHARTEAAANLVATMSLPMPSVAARCGFRSAESLRQAFVGRYGIPPSQYRALHSPDRKTAVAGT